MKDIDRRIAIIDIEDELAKTLAPCPFCGGSMNDFPGVMIFEKRRINTDLYHVIASIVGLWEPGRRAWSGQ